MTSTRLSPLDAAWLFTETRATPNHVGGLLPFKLPPGAPKDFMLQLMADFRSHREFAAPWNRRLKYAFNKNPVPAWIEDDNMDMEYHVRHAALPWPGGERELGDTSEGMMVPFDAPASILNGRVREKRRFATQQFSLVRLRNLATAANCTLNDIVLAICGGALRRFLLDSDALPDKPLTAGIPISVRPKDDENTGNAITFIISTLGTDIEDPAERLAAIRASVHHAKEHEQSLPKKAMTQYTVLLMAPTLLTLLTGIGGRTQPMLNITISNVPGPDKPMYFRGAELLATYPVSIVTHGQALNITCQSYAGFMNFGFTACHASVPHMQRVAVFTGEALDELEAVFMRPVKAAVKKPPVKKSVAKKAVVTKLASAKKAVVKIAALKKIATRNRSAVKT